VGAGLVSYIWTAVPPAAAPTPSPARKHPERNIEITVIIIIAKVFIVIASWPIKACFN
jgi:hypothetical protein